MSNDDTTHNPDALPVAARLYYSGSANRRYKRASVRSGPGEPLCFVSVAEDFIRRARANERIAVAGLIQAVKVGRRHVEEAARLGDTQAAEDLKRIDEAIEAASWDR